jgi:glutathione S-transferase
MALTFFHGQGSPYSWRVWLALEHKAVAYDLKVLSFSAGDTTRPEFVAINPRHQVPTIVDGDFALWESTAILEYLDERYAASGSRLFPKEVRERARVRRLMREAENYLGKEALEPLMHEYLFKDGAEPDADKVAAARARLDEELAYFAAELRGAFLAADVPGAADFVLYPALAYVARLTARKPETRLAERVPPALAQWARRIEALPYYDKTFPPHWR